MPTIIFCGGSVASLLSANVMADASNKIIILEQDSIESCHSRFYRECVPQGSQAHLLLGKGISTIQSILPDFISTLIQNGAIEMDRNKDCLWYRDTVKPQFSSGKNIYGFTRPILEHTIRQLVSKNHFIEYRYNTRVRDFCLMPSKIVSMASSSKMGKDYSQIL